MTNIQLIAEAAQANGIEGALYTYQEWKKQGYQVMKGEKAALKVRLWIMKKGKKEETSENVTEENKGNFFQKTANLFTEEQVKEIKVAVTA